MTTVANNLLVSRSGREGTKEVIKVVYFPKSRTEDTFLVIYDMAHVKSTEVVVAVQSILTNHMPGKITANHQYLHDTHVVIVDMAKKLDNPVTAIKVFNQKLVELLSNTKRPKQLPLPEPDHTFKIDPIDVQDFDFGEALVTFLNAIHIDSEEVQKVLSMVEQQTEHVEHYLYVHVAKIPPTEHLYFEQATRSFDTRLRVYILTDNNLWIWVEC